MNEKINIIKEDGSNVSSDIICLLENTNNNKRYIYYTLNETVGAGPNSTVKIYVSKLKQDNPVLDAPISEEDWNVLKGYMGDALKGNANPEVKYIPLNEIGNFTSVSDRAIAMPTSYDYINKQRGLYAQSVATMSTPTEPTPTPVQETPQEQPQIQPQVQPTVEPTPAVTEETPVAPTPAVEEPTPVAPPTTPVIEEAKEIQNPTPAPVAEPVTPIIEQQPASIEAPVSAESDESTSDSALKLEPIDLSTIEKKYEEMIAEINVLKDKELEAAKRYNATIELSSMHIDQHANYVQNDIKENIQDIATGQPVQTQPTPEPIVQQPVAPTQTVPVQPTVEPTPVTPIVPEPAPAMSEQDLETNWFDMPANN